MHPCRGSRVRRWQELAQLRLSISIWTSDATYMQLWVASCRLLDATLVNAGAAVWDSPRTGKGELRGDVLRSECLLESCPPSVLVLGGGPWGGDRWWGCSLMNGIGGLLRDPTELFSPCHPWGYCHRRGPSSDHAGPAPWTCSLQNCGK